MNQILALNLGNAMRLGGRVNTRKFNNNVDKAFGKQIIQRVGKILIALGFKIADDALIQRFFVHTGFEIDKRFALGVFAIICRGAQSKRAANAVIGKDGFGYTRQNGHNIFIPHVGRVVIGERVSVGANTCIDRGAMTDTKVGNGTKIDNLCQIAHGVVIGEECFLASGVGLAGGIVVGDRALLGGHVGVANGVKIGNDASVGANSGVFRNIPDGESHMGYPAGPGTEFMRHYAWLKKQMKNEKK